MSWAYYDKQTPFQEIVGQTFDQIDQLHGEPCLLTFYTAGIPCYAFGHIQDCCETVWLDDINGDLEDLIDSPITSISERTNQYEGHQFESETWTFYHITSAKGTVILRFCGSSNGYYSEAVNFFDLRNQI